MALLFRVIHDKHKKIGLITLKVHNHTTNRPLKNRPRLRGSGSLGQMSMGNNMAFSKSGEEVKAASRFELDTWESRDVLSLHRSALA